MFIRILLFIFIFVNLNASSILKKIYYIDSNNITISSILEDVKKDKILFQIEKNRYSKRVKSSLLIKMLQQSGYKEIQAKSNYITFKKRSPINTSKIKNDIKLYFKRNYEIINIQDIEVNPREFITKLPQEFTTNLKKRNFLSKTGIAFIQTDKKRRYFFDYTIKATIPVYITTTKLKKNTQISVLNTKTKDIILNKLRAKPIQKIVSNALETKYQLSKDKILTVKNTQRLHVIKRGSMVNVILHNSGIDISFSAKALKDARVGDTLKVENSNKKILKVIAIGKNKTEMW